MSTRSQPLVQTPSIDRTTIAPTTTDCPVCGETLTNGQGLRFCPDCEFTATVA